MNDPITLATIVSDEIVYDADGRIDFVAMLNFHRSRDVRPEENAFIDYARIVGPPSSTAENKQELCKWLQIDAIPNRDPCLTGEAWVEALRAASRKPRYFYPLVPLLQAREKGCRAASCSLEYTQSMRDLALRLALNVLPALGSDNMEGAIEDLQTIHRMAAHVAQGSTCVEKLFAVAIEGIANETAELILADPKITGAQLAGYRQFLRPHPLELSIAAGVSTGERYISLDAVQATEFWGIESIRGVRDRSESWMKDRKLSWSPLDWSAAARTVSQKIDLIVEHLRQPDELVRLRELESFETDLQPPEENAWSLVSLAFSGPTPRGEALGQIIAYQIMPAISSLVAAEIRNRMRREMLELGLAITAFRLENGRCPETLEVLVPKYLAQVPSDRFTQQAMIYRVYEDGFELISAGKDGKFDDDPSPNSGNDIRFSVRPIQRPPPANPVETPVQ